MDERQPSPPLDDDDIPIDDMVPPDPRRPALFDDPENDAVFDAALEDIVNRQLQQRRQFLMHARHPPIPANMLLPAVVEFVLSPQNSDEENDPEPNEDQLRFQQRVGAFLDDQEIRREARIVLREVRARQIEVRREQQQREQAEAAAAAAAENNNNGNFRNFNGILSPSPSPSPSASPIPVDLDEADEQDPLQQARPDDNDISLLNAQMVGMRPNVSRPRKRHNSDGAGSIKRKRVTFKEDSSDEALNSIDDDPPDFSDQFRMHRKGFDDDDEGFYGGPPARHNSFST